MTPRQVALVLSRSTNTVRRLLGTKH
jgi:hypothetical protein